MSIQAKFITLTGAIFLCLLVMTPTPSQARNAEVEIAAVGDIMLDRGVGMKIREFGREYPFEKTTKLLTGADLAFANLENPLTDECIQSKKKYAFKGEPAFAEMLKIAGFDIFSLANNHSLDCGQIGLDRTFEFLGSQNLLHIGAGKHDDFAAVVEIKGVKVGFAAFTAISPVEPGSSFSGVAKADPKEIIRAINELQSRADVVVVSFHWGTEYTSIVNREQNDLARLAVESGADIVVGHHPHVLQGIKVIDRGPGKRKALIAFSLGNFVFDSPVRLIPLVGQSMILKLRIDSEGLTRAEVVPLTIEGYRPEIASGNAEKQIFERVARLSGVFGTKLREGRIVLSGETPEEGAGIR